MKTPAERPFTLTEARQAGLDYWHLRAKRYRRLGPATYVSAKRPDSELLRLQAAACRLPARSAFSGLTAAWLHGLDVKACDPIEVTIPKGLGVSARSGMKVSRARLGPDEVACVRGLLATGVLRTLEDLGRRLSLTEATVIVDMALHAGLVEISAFLNWVHTRQGGRGLINLRQVALHAEPKAESAMETRLRMLLVLAGLPRPEAQVPVHDRNGRFVGRPDLFYPELRLGLEYDGGLHRESLVADDRRQNRLLEAGIHLLRFTAGDVLSHPNQVVAQVRTMLQTSESRRSNGERAA